MGSDYTVLTRTPSADRTDTVVTVHRIRDGRTTPWLYAEVEKIIDRTGASPSECHVLVRNLSAEDEESINVCLAENALSPPQLPGGSRIKCMDGETALFSGELVRPAELNRAGAVRLVFHDDRSLLARLPVAGSFVYDTESDSSKLIPRNPLRWNPEGRGNCIERSGSAIQAVPMFTHVSFARAAMDAAVYNDGDTNVYPTFWTPVRALLHLWYRLYSFNWATAPAAFRHTPRIDTNKIEWPEESLVFTAREMLKKLPDPGNALNGKSFAEILTDILDATGTYTWRLGYKNDTYGTSIIQIVPRVPPEAQQLQADELDEPPVTGINIEIQRGGSADDLVTAFDFQSERDYSKMITQVQIDGAPIEIEARFVYEAGEGDTLEPAWTAAEEAAFAGIINGGVGEYARVDGQAMDGSSGRPKVYKNTIEAVQLARAEYPLVWRAFRLRKGTDLDTIMKGGAGEPLVKFYTWLLQHYRPLAGEEQVQRIYDEDGIETDERYQVKIEVDASLAGSAFHAVHANPGLRPTARGIIFLDGLTDELAGQDNIYNGSLIMDPANVQLKWIRINAVVNHDARVRAIAALQASESNVAAGISAQDPNAIAAEVDPSWLNLGTGPAGYALASADVDHPEGLRLQRQVNSYPAARATYGATAAPLNREYRTDQEDLDAIAAKRLRDRARPGRVDAWRYIGIRPEFRAGTFIDSIVTKGVSQPVYRLINACVVEATFNFKGPQVTELKLEGF